MAGTIVTDRIESDASYASSINIASPVIISNTATINGNVNFDSGTVFVDVTNNRLGVGTTTPTSPLDVNGLIRTTGFVTNPSSGAGMEMAWDGTQGIIQAYSNRAALTAAPVYLVSGQLRFPPTQIASADANTLDDYEEGSWTPSINGGSSNGVLTNNLSAGSYIKIGSMVWVHCQLHFNCTTAGSGAFSISNLPFVAAALNGHGFALALGALFNWNIDNSAYQLGARVNESSSSIFFWNNIDAGSDALLSWPFAGGGAQVFGTITGCYRAAS